MLTGQCPLPLDPPNLQTDWFFTVMLDPPATIASSYKISVRMHPRTEELGPLHVLIICV